MNIAISDRPTTPHSTEASVYTRIGSLLGLKIRSEVDLINRLEKGLTSATVHRLRARAPLTDAEVFQLIAPRRTMNRREVSGQRLTPEEAGKTVRLARVAARAQMAFAGQRDYAAKWLRESKSGLGNLTPLQALATEFGALAVEELLVGIEHGMFV